LVASFGGSSKICRRRRQALEATASPGYGGKLRRHALSAAANSGGGGGKLWRLVVSFGGGSKP